MADEREIIVEACSLISLACSLATASLIVKIKKKTLHVGEKVHPRADNNMENVTLCYGNLLLLKW